MVVVEGLRWRWRLHGSLKEGGRSGAGFVGGGVPGSRVRAWDSRA